MVDAHELYATLQAAASGASARMAQASTRLDALKRTDGYATALLQVRPVRARVRACVC